MCTQSISVNHIDITDKDSATTCKLAEGGPCFSPIQCLLGQGIRALNNRHCLFKVGLNYVQHVYVHPIDITDIIDKDLSTLSHTLPTCPVNERNHLGTA